MRLSGQRQFAAVFRATVRASAGPLLIHGSPNALEHLRYGLSVPVAVGTAVKRNRIKRLLREAIRHTQHDWPGSYDVVIRVRPHQPLPVQEYQTLLLNAMKSIHATWLKTQSKPT
jgi:ribonuclease P protein component